jgi:anti-sigma regulatory factor (Ser/Thr protein kinase)
VAEERVKVSTRSGAAAAHRGYFHEAAFYGSDEDFLDLVVPFFADGLAAGEPVVSAFTGHNQALVRDAFGAGGGIRFVDGDVQYANPASTIRRYRQMLAEYAAAGAGQVRIGGDVPHPGVGVPWEWWARYEAAVNHAYDDFPLWGLCPYDTRRTPAEVLDQVRHTHPRIATPAGHHRNPSFVDPKGFLAGRASAWRDPLEAAPPRAELTDPTAAAVRAALAAFTDSADLPEDDSDGLLVAATEAVTNAIKYGLPPVTVRLWSAPGRVVVTVTDRGAGPADPFAGLMPGVPSPAGGGLGLWMAHQMCAYVTLQRGPEGFTVRLIAGRG